MVQNYFYDLKKDYLTYTEPWKQSGFSGPEERWEKCRRPIADLITSSGTFLDIGCANGYLLECIMKWTGQDGITITPYGLDIGEKLVMLAKKRLAQYADNFYVGNAFTWLPPMRFDYVRTELVYVPENNRKPYIERLMRDFLAGNGALLVCEYRPSKSEIITPWVDDELRGYGYRVTDTKSAIDNGKELTRVALLK